jgi:hypothetical protein
VSTDPVREGVVRGDLEITIKTLDEPLIVPVVATAVPGPCGELCNTPVALCPAVLSVLTHEKVALLGIGRTGDGYDTECAWSVASAPRGSTAATSATGTCGADFEPDVPGDYRLHLEASADGASAGCDTTVTVGTYEGLRVLLDWDAPEDVDLHLVHPGVGADLAKASSWFVNPWDCYYYYPSPFWDGPSNQDDPVLVREDQVGNGPEEIRIASPSSEHDYYVGAHWYFVLNSSPGVNVTARILCNDETVAVASARLGRVNDAAFLGTVRWADGTCTFEPDGTVQSVPFHL